MSAQPDIAEIDLHAFIDGELDAEQYRRVDAAIKADSALAERAAAYRIDKAMLKGMFGPLADRPLPKEWLTLVDLRAPAGRPMSWHPAAVVAAALLVMASLGCAYWGLLRPEAGGDVVQLALDAREATLTDVTVDDAADVRRYDEVLSGILASKVQVPDLSRMDYRLTAIRFYGDAAELSYHDTDDRRLTLYLHRSDGRPRFDLFERAGIRICVWQDDRISLVIAGNVSVAAMQKLASLAYIGLTV